MNGTSETPDTSVMRWRLVRMGSLGATWALLIALVGLGVILFGVLNLAGVLTVDTSAWGSVLAIAVGLGFLYGGWKFSHQPSEVRLTSEDRLVFVRAVGAMTIPTRDARGLTPGKTTDLEDEPRKARQLVVVHSEGEVSLWFFEPFPDEPSVDPARDFITALTARNPVIRVEGEW